MDDLKIGVIGSGGRGGLARYAHRPEEGSRVVACCDVEMATESLRKGSVPVSVPRLDGELLEYFGEG